MFECLHTLLQFGGAFVPWKSLLQSGKQWAWILSKIRKIVPVAWYEHNANSCSAGWGRNKIDIDMIYVLWF